MKASELRIGNYIYRKNFNNELIISKITGYDLWHSEKLNEANHLVEWNSLLEIPLTKEWLIKFGFKPFCKDWQLHGIIIHTRKRGFIINKSTIQMEYVHQLQNYVFAKTGKELTLKN